MAAERPFVGRDTELRRLSAALEGSVAGGGRLVRIVGEPGIGKTRLADALAELATSRGFAVAWGRCWEAGGAPAFWPWAQIERSLGAHDAASETSLLSAAVAAPTAGTSSAADAEQTRFRVFDAVSQRLVRASTASPLLIVIDDAHAADLPSLHLLRFVARGLRSTRMMIALTHREVEARLRQEAGDLLGKIARDGETLSLGRLHESDVDEWLRGVGRANVTAARVHRATEGNPLFVQELLELPSPDDWHGGASDPVRVAIAEHLSRLSAQARAVIEPAAVLGRETSRADLMKLVDAPCDVEAALREATSIGVIEPRGAERIAFRHILLRDDVYGAISAQRRAELHVKAADVFARRASLGDDSALAQAAHHDVEAANAGGDVARAVASARRAAARALASVAYEEAAELLQRAVSLLEARGALEDATAAEVLIDLGEALVLSGFGPRGREVCARAAALAKAVGEKRSIVRAALVYGSEILTGRRDERMIALLRDAMEAVGPEPSPARARVMSRLSSALIPAPLHAQEPRILARGAIEMARASGDRLALLHTLQFTTGGLAFRARTEDRRSLAQETVALAMELDRPAVAAMALPWAIASAYDALDAPSANHHIAELHRLTQRMPQANYRVRMPLLAGMRATMAGAWDEVDACFAEARALADNSETPLPAFLLAFGLVTQHYARLDPALIEPDMPLLQRVLGGFEVGRALLSLAVAVRARAGGISLEEARAIGLPTLRELLNFAGADVLPATGPASCTAVLLQERPIIEQLVSHMAGHVKSGDRMMFMAGCVGTLGPTSLILAEMYECLGRRDDALEQFDEAFSVADAIGATLFAARATAGKERVRAMSSGSSASPPPSARPTTKKDSARPSPPSAAPPAIVLEREGEMWTLRAGDEKWHLKPSKGLVYLATLLAHPHEELHVAQLVGAGEEVTGDAGPMLDEKSKASYRRRAGDLRAALDEATAHADEGRAARVREELDALGEELARAVGLGGRDRKAASDVERMRVNVQRRLKDAIDRVRTLSPAIGRYLDASVRTGSFCSYAPAWTGKDG
jgi:tetratricopeptide (TPR) repeat protein